MVDIPWPFTNSPGDEAQEGSGRLINVFLERRGDDQGGVWRRAPGCVVWAQEPTSGSAAGTAGTIGISSVKNALGEACGTATASGGGRTPTLIGGAGQAKGTASVSGDLSVIIDVAGSAAGTASADAEGTS